jgi:hypothetical protein
MADPIGYSVRARSPQATGGRTAERRGFAGDLEVGKKSRVILQSLFAAVLVFGLSACTNPYDPVQRAVGGGVLGAGSGAAIGAAAGDGPSAALGAAIGGEVGVPGGAATTPSPPGYYGYPGGYYGYPGYPYGSPSYAYGYPVPYGYPGYTHGNLDCYR